MCAILERRCAGADTPEVSKRKKSYQPVSRILFLLLRQAVIIYLAPALLQGSSCLPSGIGRAALNRRYMWHFSMQGLPAPSVTGRGRGLLPHVFNLTLPFLRRVGQLFSVALSVDAEASPGA